MDLSIVIVNWNSREYLRECLQSLRAHVDGLAHEIIVIDSGSFDGCGEMLRETFPAVAFIQAPTNLGFARANNVAFAVSAGRHVLFLNPDTCVRDDAITRMLRHLDALADAGAIGCRLLNTDGTLQTSCVQAQPTILNQVLDAAWLRGRWPRARLWGTAALFTSSATPVVVPALSGACLMVKRDVFEQVGRFSEDYFMYAEDVDLGYKMARAGHRSYYLPDAAIVHHGGGSSGTAVSTFAAVMMRESIARFLRKTRGATYARAFRLVMLLAAVTRLALLLVAFPALGLRGRVRAWATSVRKWLAILDWSLRGRAIAPDGQRAGR